MQLELFKVLEKDNAYERGLECNNCGFIWPKHYFQHLSSGEIKRRCRNCKNEQKKLVRYLKNTNTYPDEKYRCPICDRSIEELGRKGQTMLLTWVLDHCHASETFRGWLCFNCNTGLGAFKDNINNVGKAYEYLDNHIQKT
tara:strand:- start:300 stop:722 length:423 start_codon:yes stop_codon:yes gene_type:complete